MTEQQKSKAYPLQLPQQSHSAHSNPFTSISNHQIISSSSTIDNSSHNLKNSYSIHLPGGIVYKSASLIENKIQNRQNKAGGYSPKSQASSQFQSKQASLSYVFNQVPSEEFRGLSDSQIQAGKRNHKSQRIRLQQKPTFEETQKNIFDSHLAYLSKSQVIVDKIKKSFDSSAIPAVDNFHIPKTQKQTISSNKVGLPLISPRKQNHSSSRRKEGNSMLINDEKQESIQILEELSQNCEPKRTRHNESQPQKNTQIQNTKSTHSQSIDIYNASNEVKKCDEQQSINSLSHLETSFSSPLTFKKKIQKMPSFTLSPSKYLVIEQKTQTNRNNSNNKNHEASFQLPSDYLISGKHTNSHFSQINVHEEKVFGEKSVLGKKVQSNNYFEDQYVGACIASHVGDKFRFLQQQPIGGLSSFVKKAPYDKLHERGNDKHCYGISKHFYNKPLQPQNSQQLLILRNLSQKSISLIQPSSNEEKLSSKKVLEGIVKPPILSLNKQTSIVTQEQLQAPSSAQQLNSGSLTRQNKKIELASKFKEQEKSQPSQQSIALPDQLQKSSQSPLPKNTSSNTLNQINSLHSSQNIQIPSKSYKLNYNLNMNNMNNSNSGVYTYKTIVQINKKISAFFHDSNNLKIFEKFTQLCREFSKLIELLFQLEKNLNKNIAYLMRLIGTKAYLINEIIDLQFKIVHFQYIESLENKLLTDNILKTYFPNFSDLKTVISNTYIKDLQYINGSFEEYMNAQQVALATKISDNITAEYKMVKQKEKEVILDQLDCQSLKNLSQKQKKTYAFFHDYLYNIQPRRNTYKEIKEFERNFGQFSHLSQIERDIYENLDKSYNQIRISNNLQQE